MEHKKMLETTNHSTKWYYFPASVELIFTGIQLGENPVIYQGNAGPLANPVKMDIS